MSVNARDMLSLGAVVAFALMVGFVLFVAVFIQ